MQVCTTGDTPPQKKQSWWSKHKGPLMLAGGAILLATGAVLFCVATAGGGCIVEGAVGAGVLAEGSAAAGELSVGAAEAVAGEGLVDAAAGAGAEGALSAGGEAAAETATETAVHGNSALSPARAYLYRLSTRGGDYLKTGISKNPGTRYTKTFMEDKKMVILQSGSRREMLNLERYIVERDPGPLNYEPWAGKSAWDVP